MNKLYLLPQDERGVFFRAAADDANIPFEIIEKDYWVVWTLDRLFSLPDLTAHLTFKGGTSLSKVYGVIDRFSEDVDLSIEKEFFGYGKDNSPETAPSRKKQKAILEKLAADCVQYVQGQLLKDLRTSIAKELGTTDGWKVELDSTDPDARSLSFEYPSITQPGGYIRPFVKVEMGARSEHWPVSNQKLRSYASETLKEKIHDDQVTVRVLNAERTFWEKATILHRLAHLPISKAVPARMSRHFYDFVQLLNSAIKDSALKDISLLERVANHNNIYFPATWANYASARQGTLKLAPTTHALEGLERDYEQMEAMFYRTQRPEWSQILKTIEEFERDFNGGGRG
jgi:hypothetical protein